MRVLVLCLVLMLGGGLLVAQTMVEGAILTGATGTGAAKAGSGIGAGIGKILGQVNSTAAAASKGAASSSGTGGARSSGVISLPQPAAEPIRPKPSKTDFEGVENGMKREELVAKVGKPTFAISMTEDGHLQETMRYTTKEGASAKIRVTDGKVASIEWPQPIMKE